MASRWIEINDNLLLCRKVYAILKQKNPHILPNKIDIIAHRDNSRKCSIAKEDRRLGMKDEKNWIAHYDDPFLMTPHICIKQDFLFFPFDLPTQQQNRCKDVSYREYCKGNWILIEVMCHELSHSIVLGHGKDFFKLYHHFLSQMASSVFTGDFYYWYTRQHQSMKRIPPTREWLDHYLVWK